MGYYPEPDSHIRDKVKVILDLTNYATKEELDHATRVDTSALSAKKDFMALKVEVNVPNSLNNLRIKVSDLDVGKLKTVPIGLKKLSDVVANKVVRI